MTTNGYESKHIVVDFTSAQCTGNGVINQTFISVFFERKSDTHASP
jgi:hypothetical protein